MIRTSIPFPRPSYFFLEPSDVPEFGAVGCNRNSGPNDLRKPGIPQRGTDHHKLRIFPISRRPIAASESSTSLLIQVLCTDAQVSPMRTVRSQYGDIFQNTSMMHRRVLEEILRWDALAMDIFGDQFERAYVSFVLKKASQRRELLTHNILRPSHLSVLTVCTRHVFSTWQLFLIEATGFLSECDCLARAHEELLADGDVS
jgi:hypothetical protein